MRTKKEHYPLPEENTEQHGNWTRTDKIIFEQRRNSGDWLGGRRLDPAIEREVLQVLSIPHLDEYRLEIERMKKQYPELREFWDEAIPPEHRQ